MGVNKVIYDGLTLIDLTEDTVSSDTLLSGFTAHDKAGNRIVGTMSAGVELNLAETFDKFQPTSTVFSGNTVTSTDGQGNSMVYNGTNEVYTSSEGVTITRTFTFNSDGSITDIFASSDGTTMRRKTIFNSNGSVSYEYS